MAPPPPTNLCIVIEPNAWGDSDMGEMHAVLNDIAVQLLRAFPQPQPHRRVHVHHDAVSTPRTFAHAAGDDYRIRLSANGRLWCRFTYQFAHELAHIALGHMETEDLMIDWEQEVLAHLASLFALRGMAVSWRTAPAYPHWREYALHFDEYCNEELKNTPPLHNDWRMLIERNMPLLEEERTKDLPSKARMAELRAPLLSLAAALLPTFMERPQLWCEVTGATAPLTGSEELAHILSSSSRCG